MTSRLCISRAIILNHSFGWPRPLLRHLGLSRGRPGAKLLPGSSAIPRQPRPNPVRALSSSPGPQGGWFSKYTQDFPTVQPLFALVSTDPALLLQDAHPCPAPVLLAPPAALDPDSSAVHRKRQDQLVSITSSVKTFSTPQQDELFPF